MAWKSSSSTAQSVNNTNTVSLAKRTQFVCKSPSVNQWIWSSFAFPAGPYKKAWSFGGWCEHNSNAPWWLRCTVFLFDKCIVLEAIFVEFLPYDVLAARAVATIAELQAALCHTCHPTSCACFCALAFAFWTRGDRNQALPRFLVWYPRPLNMQIFHSNLETE